MLATVGALAASGSSITEEMLATAKTQTAAGNQGMTPVARISETSGLPGKQLACGNRHNRKITDNNSRWDVSSQ
jgi:hypothetical protein